MSIDLTGGLAPELDLMRLDRPADDPNYRESVSVWLFDDHDRIQLPRWLLDDVAGDPEHRTQFFNIAFADGRVVVKSAIGDSLPMQDADGAPTVYGGGGLVFRCIEPFLRWTVSYQGEMIATTSAALAAGPAEGPSVPVQLEVELTSAVPPWVQGTMTAESGEMLSANRPEGRFQGVGWRFEQLVLARGRCRIGADVYELDGRGLRVHRQSSRDVTGFRGHCWQTTVFPSGRAFGYQMFPPYDDGTPSYQEGFVFRDGQMRPAVVQQAPWMTSVAPSGQDASVVLSSDGEEITINGRTHATTFRNNWSDTPNSGWPSELLLQQGCARYEWDGEEAFGMIERSAFKDRLEGFA